MSPARILQDAHLRVHLPLSLDVPLWKAIAYSAGASALLVGGVLTELTTVEQDRLHDDALDECSDEVVLVYPGLASTLTSLLHTLSTALVGVAGFAALFSPSHTSTIRDVRRAGLALAITSGVTCIVREILEKRRLWGLGASGVARLSLARSLHIACAVPLVLAECDTSSEPSPNVMVGHAAAALGGMAMVGARIYGREVYIHWSTWGIVTTAAFATGKWMVRFQQSELGSWLLHARAQRRGKRGGQEGE